LVVETNVLNKACNHQGFGCLHDHNRPRLRLYLTEISRIGRPGSCLISQGDCN